MAFDRTFTHTAEWKFSAAGLQIDLCIDLIKVQNSAIVALPTKIPGPSRHDGFQIIGDISTLRVLSQVKHMLNQSYIYSRLKIPLYIPGSIKTHRIYTRDFIYPARITMKLYDMIQVYSSGSTVIMHMHYIWPVLHMTSCLVAINKNRDMCFDMKNGKKKKKTYFSGEIPVNDCRNVWRGLKSIRLILKKILRISKVSCKESSRSQSNAWKNLISLNLSWI